MASNVSKSRSLAAALRQRILNGHLLFNKRRADLKPARPGENEGESIARAFFENHGYRGVSSQCYRRGAANFRRKKLGGDEAWSKRAKQKR